MTINSITRAVGVVGLLACSLGEADALAQQVAGEGSGVGQVALTPPMGWNPWNAFRTDVDEARIMKMATLLVDRGLANSGYRYVNIDDGWAMKRQPDGRLQVRTSTFPSANIGAGQTSFRPWVDKLHSMGLKAGIYTDIGRNTCAQIWDAQSPNQPEGGLDERQVGAFGFEERDAALFFAEWGFDYIKIDACGVADYGGTADLVAGGRFRPFDQLIYRGHPQASEAKRVEAIYANLTRAVRNASPGPDPVISICAWGEVDVSEWAGKYGHLWRTSGDIWKTWDSMLGTFDSAAPRALFAGPGRWNDPDLLEVGNGDFGPDNLIAARTHFSLWSIIAAPLFLSLDLEKASPEILDIVKNTEVIAINQDSAGNQGVIIRQDKGQQIIVKQLADGSKAVTLTNRGRRAQTLTLSMKDIHFDPAAPLQARDVWRHADHKITNGRIVTRLLPRETLMLRITGKALDPGVRYLDEMPSSVRVLATGYMPSDRGPKRPWIPARLGYLPSGEPIMSKGRHDHDALATGEGARIEIALPAGSRRFRAMPGQPGSIVILGDGRVLYRGPKDKIAPINIDVSSVKLISIAMPVSGDKKYNKNVTVLYDAKLEL